MTSKISMFKLIKEQLRHKIWLIALSALMSFMFGPVFFFMYNQSLTSYKRGASAVVLSYISNYLSFAMIIVFVGTIIVAFGCFSYLFSKKKIDMYHSAPVNRIRLFAANYICGFLIWFIPAFIFFICVWVLCINRYGNDVSTLYITRLFIICLFKMLVSFFTEYNLCLLAIMISGYAFAAVTNMAVLGAGAYFVYLLLNTFFKAFFSTFVSFSIPSECFIALSPLIYGITNGFLNAYSTGTGELGTYYLIIAIPLAIFNLVCAALLYLRRPSELAEQGMSNTWYRTVLRIFSSVSAALIGGIFFYACMEGSSNIFAWCIFGVLLFGILAFGIINIICTRSFKSFFSDKIQLLSVLIVSAAVFIGFFYNLYGYDTSLPKLADVENAYIYTATFADFYSGYAYSMDESGALTEDYISQSNYNNSPSPAYTAVDPEKLYNMLNSCIYSAPDYELRYLSRIDTGIDGIYFSYTSVSAANVYSEENEQKFMSSVYVQLVLKNGKTFVRKYTLCINDELNSFFEYVLNTDEYQNKNYPISTGEWTNPLYISVAGFDSDLDHYSSAVTIIRDYDRINNLMEAYTEDFKEHYSFAELIDNTRKNLYTLEIYYRVKYKYDSDEGEGVECFYLYVPENYTNTVEYLENYFNNY